MLGKEVDENGSQGRPNYSLDVTMMTDFVKNYRAKFDRYPSDWAVLLYDAVYALKQGIDIRPAASILKRSKTP